jgi:hypothetical protein
VRRAAAAAAADADSVKCLICGEVCLDYADLCRHQLYVDCLGEHPVASMADKIAGRAIVRVCPPALLVSACAVRRSCCRRQRPCCAVSGAQWPWFCIETTYNSVPPPYMGFFTSVWWRWRAAWCEVSLAATSGPSERKSIQYACRSKFSILRENT